MILDILKILAAIVFVSAAAVVVAVLITAVECDQYGTQTGIKTEMRFGTCYIESGGNWYSWAEWKYRLVGKDAK